MCTTYVLHVHLNIQLLSDWCSVLCYVCFEVCSSFMNNWLLAGSRKNNILDCHSIVVTPVFTSSNHSMTLWTVRRQFRGNIYSQVWELMAFLIRCVLSRWLVYLVFVFWFNIYKHVFITLTFQVSSKPPKVSTHKRGNNLQSLTKIVSTDPNPHPPSNVW